MPEVSQFDWSIVMTFNCTDIYGFSVDTEGFKIGVVTFVCQLQSCQVPAFQHTQQRQASTLCYMGVHRYFRAGGGVSFLGLSKPLQAPENSQQIIII